MNAPEIQIQKYKKLLNQSFYVKKGKVVNVIGLTIESAGPDSKMGDICVIYPEEEGAKPIRAEVVGFRDRKTLLMPFDLTEGVGAGSIVVNTGDVLKVNVSDDMLGQVLNGPGWHSLQC